MTHTTLRGAGLARTVSDDCVLDGVSLRQSDLHYSRFVHAQGVRVDFGGCNLDRANFHAAVWQDTSFNGADVRTAPGNRPGAGRGRATLTANGGFMKRDIDTGLLTTTTTPMTAACRRNGARPR